MDKDVNRKTKGNSQVRNVKKSGNVQRSSTSRSTAPKSNVPQKSSVANKKKNSTTNIKGKKTKKGKYKSNKSKNMRCLAALAMAGLGVTVTLSKCSAKEYEGPWLGEAMDLPGDSYSSAIPVNTDEGIKLVPDDSLVVVDGKIETNDEKDWFNVTAIDWTGEYITGQVDGAYLEELAKISEENLEKYKIIYTTIQDDVSIKESAKVKSNDKVTGICENIQVLGGEYKASKDGKIWVSVLYVDDDGELIEGYMDLDYLKVKVPKQIEQENVVMEEENVQEEENEVIRMRVNTGSDGEAVELSLRSSKNVSEDNLIKGLPNKAMVYALSDYTEESENFEWRNVKYIDYETGKEYEGWVVNDFLKESDEIAMTVDTSSEGNIELNVREYPTAEAQLITTVPDGAEINIEPENLNNLANVGDEEWTKVTLNDGTEGYVCFKYLKESDKERENNGPVRVDYTVSSSGNVVGIDVSEGVSAEQLRSVLTNFNPIKSSTLDGIDTSSIAGNINYVYIKIGASAYGEGPLRVLEIDTYREQAAVCEELGVPYGFYYYSTSIDEDEAEQEAEYINDSIDLLKNRRYNLLPVAIDVELANEKDRQEGLDVTNAKAHLTNLVSEKQGNTILYGGGRAIATSSPECILDLDEYNSLLENNNSSGVWLATPSIETIGRYYKTTQDYVKEINPDIYQVLLDTELSVQGKTVPCDVNIMSESKFVELMRNHPKVELTQDEMLKDVDDGFEFV